MRGKEQDPLARIFHVTRSSSVMSGSLDEWEDLSVRKQISGGRMLIRTREGHLFIKNTLKGMPVPLEKEKWDALYEEARKG